MDHAAKVSAKYIAPISEAELAVRLLEAYGGRNRPAGATAEQALAELDEVDSILWRRAAVAAMEYWRECIATANKSN